jgi:hypothetical protein
VRIALKYPREVIYGKKDLDRGFVGWEEYDMKSREEVERESVEGRLFYIGEPRREDCDWKWN